ncbi:MAG TPA: vitamin K epoxide reductase family protein [Oligoflexus sp.]|uniref:vitamin K epoxide reductase family protein n=1 Tax=Oligoflexus sp. TaxID=1971216 RepID=UPI002D7F6847|nr:vitamin K epoxide reductase family protein [Oligoflexus sp.]HET9241287.1 vitamin K epoxide reductase family protein [Oligoflexus sp.]
MDSHSSQHPMQGMKQRGGTRSMGDMGHPYSEARFRMLETHHKQTLWVYWTLILFGVWMLVAPFTFGSHSALVQPAGGRSVWLSLEQRATAMLWSDLFSGFLLLIFGWRSLTPNRPYSLWICCFTGIWLTLAPILFWAPKAVLYLNDTFIGAWVIALTVLIAGMPNMMLYMEMGASMPSGWTYNPSSWPQRWIMIVTGFLGWIVSRYLAAYQLGYTGMMWDPFFEGSASRVLTSDLSRSLPVSDAGLGAIAYTFECLMGFMGGPARWRTMPWMVTFFGILVIPLGLVHILLVISQPVVVGAWCTFCLLAAAIMLPMIPLEVDEVVAMGQYLARVRRRGDSLWKAFWKGGPEEEQQHEESMHEAPELLALPQKTSEVLKASFWGFSLPWNLILTSLVGLWLIFSPMVFQPDPKGTELLQVLGLLTITFSVLAMGEVIRSCRYLNVILGLGLASIPFVLNTAGSLRIHNIAVGLAIALLSIPKGKIEERYGTWQRWIL